MTIIPVAPAIAPRSQYDPRAMPNHPNRSKKQDNPAASPTPEEILAARESSGLSQSRAAELVFATLRSWQGWEAGERNMHPGLWLLFRLRLLAIAGDQEAEAVLGRLLK